MSKLSYWSPIEQRVVHTREFRGSEDFDRELDRPEFHTLAAELDYMERSKLTSSPSVNVEYALQMYEKNLATAKDQRWAGQGRWQGRENEEMRMVNVLHCHAFMRRLQGAGVDARIEYAREARVWLNPWSKMGRIGVNARVIEDGEKVERTLTTLQYEYSYEYSVMRFNKYDVPTEEKFRGWRTTLLELIRREVITEDEALRAFGPAIGAAAHFYLLQLRSYRQARMGVVA